MPTKNPVIRRPRPVRRILAFRIPRPVFRAVVNRPRRVENAPLAPRATRLRVGRLTRMGPNPRVRRALPFGIEE